MRNDMGVTRLVVVQIPDTSQGRTEEVTAMITVVADSWVMRGSLASPSFDAGPEISRRVLAIPEGEAVTITGGTDRTPSASAGANSKLSALPAAMARRVQQQESDGLTYLAVGISGALVGAGLAALGGVGFAGGTRVSASSQKHRRPCSSAVRFSSSSATS